MLDNSNLNPPAILREIEQATSSIHFTMGSDYLTGSLLRTLAATKPSGSLLELGTGTGQGTAWILDGMDANSRLVTVDRGEHCVSIAKRFLGSDPRVIFAAMDGNTFIKSMHKQDETFDFIFADMHPGKFRHLNVTLDLLSPGGIYFADDLLPLPKWEEGHASLVTQFINTIEQRKDLHITKLNWSTGLLIAVRQ
jgi:predicted O-methyltransferase YrrM